MKIPQLRNMYQKQLYTRHDAESIDGFGFAHDGQISGLLDFLALPVFKYTAQQKIDMAAYMLCFDTGTAPAVGYTITLTAANVHDHQEQKDWGMLQSQAEAANIDLIGRGTIQGQVHGLLYQPGNAQYVSDTNAKYSQSQLQTFNSKRRHPEFHRCVRGHGRAIDIVVSLLTAHTRLLVVAWLGKPFSRVTATGRQWCARRVPAEATSVTFTSYQIPDESRLLALVATAAVERKSHP